jgi:hypothetical protein
MHRLADSSGATIQPSHHHWQRGSCESGSQILAAGDARIYRALMELLAG